MCLSGWVRHSLGHYYYIIHSCNTDVSIYSFKTNKQQQKHNTATSFSRLVFVPNEVRTCLASGHTQDYDVEGL